jgi:hypothetical protein
MILGWAAPIRGKDLDLRGPPSDRSGEVLKDV